MSIINKKKVPLKFVIDVINEKGEKNRVSTNLYFLMHILNKMKKGYSPIVGICGQQRDGKSYFGVWLSYIIMKAFGKTFNLERNTVYDPSGALSKINVLSFEALLLDEAAFGYYKREWWEKQHRTFAKIIITQGRKAICYIFVSPFVGDIDKAFVKHFDIIIDVKKRGLAKVFKYTKKYRSRREYDNIEIHMDDLILEEKNLPKADWEAYKTYSNKEKDKIEKGLESEGRKEKPIILGISR